MKGCEYDVNETIEDDKQTIIFMEKLRDMVLEIKPDYDFLYAIESSISALEYRIAMRKILYDVKIGDE